MAYSAIIGTVASHTITRTCDSWREIILDYEGSQRKDGLCSCIGSLLILGSMAYSECERKKDGGRQREREGRERPIHTEEKREKAVTAIEREGGKSKVEIQYSRHRKRE